MCEHEFVQEEWIVEVCKKCGKLQQAVSLEQQLTAAQAELAELKKRLKMSEEHEEVYHKAIEVGEKFRKQNQMATWEERHAVLKSKYMARSQEENVADLLSTIVISENRAREREIYRERLCAVKDELAGAKIRISRFQQRADIAEEKAKRLIKKLTYNTPSFRDGECNEELLAINENELVSLNSCMCDRLEQAEAQCVAMQTAINRYVFGNIELLDALKAALEEK